MRQLISDLTEATKSPRKGTLAWEIQQRQRADYLKGFAQDPHGNKTPAKEYVAGPSGTSTLKEEAGSINLNLPLFIRLLEWAREECKSDVEIHQVAEKLAAIKGEASMDNYDSLFENIHLKAGSLN
jgi:hypothetical protein